MTTGRVLYGAAAATASTEVAAVVSLDPPSPNVTPDQPDRAGAARMETGNGKTQMVPLVDVATPVPIKPVAVPSFLMRTKYR